MPRRKRGRSAPKDECQKLHFQKRADQRAGGLTPEVRDWILSSIHGRPSDRAVRFYDRQSGRVTRWEVDLPDGCYLVVYDSIRKTLVTIIHPDQRSIDWEMPLEVIASDTVSFDGPFEPVPFEPW